MWYNTISPKGKEDTMRRRDYYRKVRCKQILRRMKLHALLSSKELDTPGKLANGNAGFLSNGRHTKTNRKKGHCPYRCKGQNGPKENYMKKDQIQIDDMNLQMEEYYGGEN